MTDQPDNALLSWLERGLAWLLSILGLLVGWVGTRLHARADGLDRRVRILESNSQTSDKAAVDRAEIKHDLHEFSERSERQWRDLRREVHEQHNLVLRRFTELSDQIARRVP